MENISFDVHCQSNFQASDAHASRATWKSWKFSYEMALITVQLKFLHKGKVAHKYPPVDISHLQTLTVLFRKQNSISQSIAISISLCCGMFFSNKIEGIAFIYGCNWNSNASPSSLCILVLWEGSSYPSPGLRLIPLLCNGQEAQEPSETCKVTSEVPCLEIRTAHGSSLRKWGAGWGLFGSFKPFCVIWLEAQWGHLLLDSLSKCQHLVAEDTKGMATQLQEKQNLKQGKQMPNSSCIWILGDQLHMYFPITT